MLQINLKCDVWLAALAVLIFSSACTPKWRRVSDDTLRFDGYIEEGELERFRKVYNQNIKNLMVRSGGGSGIEGTKLGFELARAGLTVVVDGPCLSSCANYVFLAGKKKIIRGGCVGFHGSGNALCAMNADIDKENCEKFADAIKQEEKFFELVGVNPELFKRSQTEDKGMADGKTHSVLMLTAKTFEKYGIYQVEGEQSKECIELSDGVMD